jgi:hypothetical protein
MNKDKNVIMEESLRNDVWKGNVKIMMNIRKLYKRKMK